MDQLENKLEARTTHLLETMNYPEVFHKGGWTTIQYRFSGALDFNRSWSECAEGFGDVEGEFWFGLEKLYQTVRDRKHELLVVLEGVDGAIKYAHYGDFRIGNEEERYKIKRLGQYSGTAGDSLRRQKSAPFATYDKPQPGRLNRNCVDTHKGPWWCKSRYSQSHLNGKFPLWRSSDSAAKTTHSLHSLLERSTIKSSKIMIRPSDQT
ncbi:ficolin-3-like [Anopheles ziemanni]|uniref:ficolin-3-like n=1 Tax=Anopheles coustani TaxID=139045 RepID=UPI002658FFB4|nr:ficolin-3-like [Anopheles coustani]XP_058178426.1 ficolin-3-like [Anopheles ziemanni]